MADTFDQLVRRGPRNEVEPCNAATLHAGETVELLHDPDSPPFGRCKITYVNVKDKIVTFEALPAEVRVGDFIRRTEER
jgi:hypothetical protein